MSFYIKPDDGLELPEIMQWIKQTYAVRYNVHDGAHLRRPVCVGVRKGSQIAPKGVTNLLLEGRGHL